MTELLASTAIASNVGFKVRDVAARIADMDFDAAGNAEKAAWKRYVALCLMAIAKGEEKSSVVTMVFGKGGKPSKTFHNAWTLANKCRGHVTGNMAWSDILPMGIEEAFTTTIGMINTHMAVMGVQGKNEWDKVCNLSLAELEAKRKAEKEGKSNDDDDKSEDDDKPDNGNTGNDDKPEPQTLVEKTNALLTNASNPELIAVIEACAAKLGNDALVAVIGGMLAMDGMGLAELTEVTAQVANRNAAIKMHDAKPTVKAKGSLKVA